MTEYPSSIPMGRSVFGDRAAVDHVVLDDTGALICPQHSDGAVTPFGATKFNCDEGHQLAAPVSRPPYQN